MGSDLCFSILGKPPPPAPWRAQFWSSVSSATLDVFNTLQIDQTNKKGKWKLLTGPMKPVVNKKLHNQHINLSLLKMHVHRLCASSTSLVIEPIQCGMPGSHWNNNLTLVYGEIKLQIVFKRLWAPCRFTNICRSMSQISPRSSWYLQSVITATYANYRHLPIVQFHHWQLNEGQVAPMLGCTP